MSKKITAKIQILNWINGTVIYESDKPTLKEAVVDANLYGADLRNANLRNANLYDANLRNADLRNANLYGADLRNADLRNADLYDADLRGANLYDANLYDADLRNANLYDAKNGELAIAMTRILPDEGSIIGWKKCRGDKIVKLLIPAAAKRSHAFGRKCRAEYAEVLEITKDKRKVKTATSSWDESFEYKVGETVRTKLKFDENWIDECSSGIHFYITKLEAENHV